MVQPGTATARRTTARAQQKNHLVEPLPLPLTLTLTLTSALPLSLTPTLPLTLTLTRNVPQQKNEYDCGLYMLHFIEALSKRPLPLALALALALTLALALALTLTLALALTLTLTLTLQDSLSCLNWGQAACMRLGMVGGLL